MPAAVRNSSHRSRDTRVRSFGFHPFGLKAQAPVGVRRERPSAILPRTHHPRPPGERPMTDRDALYAAICAHPDEDTPRLAFADFLQEQGGKENTTRADYIRTAIRFAREETWTKTW